MKNKIIITSESRGNGIFSLDDKTWSFINKIKDGFLIETNGDYVIELTNGVKLTFSKNEEIIAAKMYNRYLSADLKHFEVYELLDSNYGNFLLYRMKKEDRRNQFIISGIAGFMLSSSIHFEI